MLASILEIDVSDLLDSIYFLEVPQKDGGLTVRNSNRIIVLTANFDNDENNILLHVIKYYFARYIENSHLY